MRAIERRIRWLETLQRRRRESGPSPAEIIRERRNKRLLAEGKEPEPELPPIPLVDETGRPLSIGEIIRARRRQRLALASKTSQSASSPADGGGDRSDHLA